MIYSIVFLLPYAYNISFKDIDVLNVGRDKVFVLPELPNYSYYKK